MQLIFWRIIRETNTEQDEKINSVLTTIPKTITGITKGLQDINNVMGVSVAVEEDDLEAKQESDLQKERDAEEKAREDAPKKLGGFSMPKIPTPKIPFMDKIKKFFGNVLMGGLAVGLLNWIQDPKNQESIDNFVDFIVDKAPLILGGILALMALPIASTMISLTGTILGLSKALVLISLKLAPALLAVAAIFFANKWIREFVDGPAREFYEEKVAPFVDEANYGDRADEGAFITKLRDNYGRISKKEDRDKLTDEEKTTQQFLRIYDEKLKELKRTKDKAKSGAMKGGGGSKEVERIENELKQMEEQLTIGGKTLAELRAEFEKDGSLPQTSITRSQTPQVSPQSQTIPTSKKTQMSGKPQVIIPLDHARTAGSIPDTTGGNTFSNSNATGADGREREHQDPAARMLQEELAKKGINAKIVKPEDFASYEEYDAYLKKMSEQGVVSVPLHFDAIQEGGGTGFLTRTRAGDSGDSSLASPINDVLSDFASKNPDLGSYKTDTAGNATVKMGAASPTALVELGEMVRWEEKHGKNFTQSDKFRELIKGVAGGVVEGGNLKPGSDAEVTSRADVPPPAPVLPPPQKVSVTPPRPPGSPTVSVIAAAVPSKQNTSGSMRRNSTLPSVGAVDQNNDTVTITKGVYSIVA